MAGRRHIQLSKYILPTERQPPQELPLERNPGYERSLRWLLSRTRCIKNQLRASYGRGFGAIAEPWDEEKRSKE